MCIFQIALANSDFFNVINTYQVVDKYLSAISNRGFSILGKEFVVHSYTTLVWASFLLISVLTSRTLFPHTHVLTPHPSLSPTPFTIYNLKSQPEKENKTQILAVIAKAYHSSISTNTV